MKKIFLFAFLVCGVTYGDDGIETLKQGCQNPGSFHNQLPPSEIKIKCHDERTEWVPTGHDDATIHNTRTVCSSAITSKPNVSAPQVCEPCSWPGSDYECDGYKEVYKEITLMFSVTCEQVMKMESINKFCQTAVLAETRATEEKIMSVKDTGRTKKVCGVQNMLNGKPMTSDWKPVTVK